MPRCYVPNNPYFQPATKLVAGITNANPAVVTTTAPHQYVSLTTVRLDIPIACGFQQINTLNVTTFTITVLSPTTFSIPLDSTAFTPFVAPDPVLTNPHTNICAMVVPIGEDNSTLNAALVNTL